MSQDDLTEIMRAEPFRPVRLVLWDGRTFDWKLRLKGRMTRDSMVLFTPEDRDPDLNKDFEFVGFDDILEAVPLDVAHA